ncbi:MAG: hypothetical protein LBO72_05685 [Helicobacteraceae bacterium]|jgi:hypothetical protein|nr:hypothetical protein [Helicobacteraceae bacterium]
MKSDKNNTTSFAIYAFVIAIALFLALYDNPLKLDGSSEEALMDSAQKIAEEFSDENEGQRFSAIFKFVLRSKYSNEYATRLAFSAELFAKEMLVKEEQKRFNEAIDNAASAKRKEALSFFNGKTADDIFSEAAKIDPDIDIISFNIRETIKQTLLDLKLPPYENILSIPQEKKGVRSIRSSLPAIRVGFLVKATNDTNITIFDKQGKSYLVTLLSAKRKHSSNDISGYPTALSIESWDKPIAAQNSNDSDLQRGTTALALVLDSETREGWKTQALDDKTKITGPATNNISHTGCELHIGRYWLYDPADGTVKLQENNRLQNAN